MSQCRVHNPWLPTYAAAFVMIYSYSYVEYILVCFNIVLMTFHRFMILSRGLQLLTLNIVCIINRNTDLAGTSHNVLNLISLLGPLYIKCKTG